MEVRVSPSRRVVAAVLDLLRQLYVLAWLALSEGWAAAYAEETGDPDVFARLRTVGQA